MSESEGVRYNHKELVEDYIKWLKLDIEFYKLQLKKIQKDIQGQIDFCESKITELKQDLTILQEED